MEHLKKHREFWDRAAEHYDGTARVQDRYLRGRNTAVLLRFFRPGMHLVEIGCGTGWEAKILKEYGCKLTLTDLSPEMVKRAYARVGRGCHYLVLPAETIDAFRITFEGAYANFGVLNCLKDLEDFFFRLARILSPGSYFIASFNNRLYWGDALFYLLRIPNFLRKRLRGYGRVVAGGKEQEPVAYYYTYRRVRRAAEPFFRLRACFALAVFLPPPYLNPAQRLPSFLYSLLKKLEEMLAHFYPFSILGDQVIMVFERRGD